MDKDTKEGQTHSFNDGCGEPAHNDMTNKDKKDNKVCCKHCYRYEDNTCFHVDCTCHQKENKCCEKCHCNEQCALRGAENCCHNGICPCHQEAKEPNFDPRMAIEVTIEDWEENLRSLWQTTRENQGKYKKVKDFIHTQKQLSYKEGESKKGEAKRVAYMRGYDEARTSLIQELIEGVDNMAKKRFANGIINAKEDRGYNQALSEVLTLLKSKLAEK